MTVNHVNELILIHHPHGGNTDTPPSHGALEILLFSQNAGHTPGNLPFFCPQLKQSKYVGTSRICREVGLSYLQAIARDLFSVPYWGITGG